MSVKKPLSYWQKRADTRMYEYQKQADTVADDIAKAYIDSTNYINKQMHDIFNAFVTKNKLSEAEARRLLKNLPDDATLADLKAAARRIEDESAKEELIKQIDSPAYAHRIGRLEALQKDIDKQTASLAKFEQNITKQHYTSLLPEAFMKTMFDTQKRAGFIFSFAKMPKSRINEILRQNWSGKIFSERIWDREKNINQTLKNELLVSFMTGRSYNKTAKEIENKMASSAYAARRLVRTESAYISNMADMESYKAAGIEKYKFLATLDLRTSDICQSMDGKVFKVSEALCGTNLPPMHTYCRSTTVSFADDKAKKNMKKRIARNPETGKVYYVDENMTYEQWEKSIDDISAEGTFEKRRTMHKALRGDTEQFERYKKVLGADNLPKDIDSFQNLKYNDKEKWEDLKYYAENIEGRPIEYVKIDRELEKLGINDGKMHPTIKAINAYILKDTSRKKDQYHIMHRMYERHITDDEVRSYKDNAIFCSVQWNGNRIKYYSDTGITVVSKVNNEWIFKTAWKKYDFDEKTLNVFEVAKQYVK